MSRKTSRMDDSLSLLACFHDVTRALRSTFRADSAYEKGISFGIKMRFVQWTQPEATSDRSGRYRKNVASLKYLSQPRSKSGMKEGRREGVRQDGVASPRGRDANSSPQRHVARARALQPAAAEKKASPPMLWYTTIALPPPPRQPLRPTIAHKSHGSLLPPFPDPPTAMVNRPGARTGGGRGERRRRLVSDRTARARSSLCVRETRISG